MTCLKLRIRGGRGPLQNEATRSQGGSPNKNNDEVDDNVQLYLRCYQYNFKILRFSALDFDSWLRFCLNDIVEIF